MFRRRTTQWLAARSIGCAVVVATSCCILAACSRSDDEPATSAAAGAEATTAPGTQRAPSAGAAAAAEAGASRGSAQQAPPATTVPQSGAMPRKAESDMGKPPVLIHCRGNEPFWSLDIEPASAIYSQLDGATTNKTEVRGKYHTLPYVKNQPFIWRGKSRDLGGDLIAVITDKPCVDTMSDSEGRTHFPYSTLVSVPGGKVRRGCCWPESPGEGGDEMGAGTGDGGND